MAGAPSPRRVVLVRHGATDWSEAGRHTGWTDVPLNSEGERQARAVAAPLARRSFSAVLSSPLQRARATCELAGLGAAEIDADLREWNYGDYEGMTAIEIQRSRPGWTIWADGPQGGETIEQVAGRADRVVGRLRGLSGEVAVFSHGHFLRVLASRWIGQEPGMAQFFNLSTASLSELGWERDWPSIHLWNDIDHLQSVAQ